MPGILSKALKSRSTLRTAIRNGKQAIEPLDRPRLNEVPPAKITDSLALDACFAADEAESHRWDYWLGIRGKPSRILAVEVHPATAGHVQKVIKKKRWALRKAEVHLEQSVSAWLWVASGRVGISKTSRSYRQLAKEGIAFAGRQLDVR